MLALNFIDNILQGAVEYNRAFSLSLNKLQHNLFHTSLACGLRPEPSELVLPRCCTLMGQRASVEVAITTEDAHGATSNGSSLETASHPSSPPRGKLNSDGAN